MSDDEEEEKRGKEALFESESEEDSEAVIHGDDAR